MHKFRLFVNNTDTLVSRWVFLHLRLFCIEFFGFCNYFCDRWKFHFILRECKFLVLRGNFGGENIEFQNSRISKLDHFPYNHIFIIIESENLHANHTSPRSEKVTSFSMSTLIPVNQSKTTSMSSFGPSVPPLYSLRVVDIHTYIHQYLDWKKLALIWEKMDDL